jgi:hypothetical protein
MNKKTLTDLYCYFDQLVDQNSNQDTLFASSYVRGFMAVEAVNFGDDNQLLTTTLYHAVLEEMKRAKNELTPQDQAIVHNFYLTLAPYFNA